MQRTTRLALIAGIAFAAAGVWLANAQQPPIKRTDLLKLDLPEIKGSEMNVWVGDIAPGAATGRHSHPTPRFVYVLEGAVVLEVDGMPSQTFKVGQAFAELPNVVHNLRNASATEPAKALGFQYAAKGQALQANAPDVLPGATK
jgi:quercetin dioxygenase-like cupin family protein